MTPGTTIAAVAESGGSMFLRAVRLIVLLGGPVLAGMVQLGLLPGLPGMAAHFTAQGQDGTFVAQNVTTIAAPAMVVGAPLVGWLAGLTGKRHALLGSVLIYGLAGVAGAFAPDLWTLLASRVILGIAAGGYVTICVSLIGDYYSNENQRDRLIGWFTVSGGAGALVVLEAAGLLTRTGGWRAPFVLYLLGILLFLLGLFVVNDVQPLPSARGATKAVDSVARAWTIYALIILVSVSMYAVTIQGTFLMTKEGISDPTIQSNVMLLTSVGTMVGAYLFRFARPLLGFYLTLALVWGLLAAGNTGFVLAATNIYLLAVCAGLVGLASGVVSPLMQTAVLNAVSPDARARAVGLAIGCIFLGQFLHPLVLAPLRAAVGLQGAFFWIGGASLTACALTVFWRIGAVAERQCDL